MSGFDPAEFYGAHLNKLILAATFDHALKILIARLVEVSRATYAVGYHVDRVRNTLRPVAAKTEDASQPESLRVEAVALTSEQGRLLQDDREILEKKHLLSPHSVCGFNVRFFHPLGKYLLAIARLETTRADVEFAAAIAAIRQASLLYGAALAQAEEKDRIVADYEKLWALQRQTTNLEIDLDEPELERVLEGVLDAAMSRVAAQSGCVLLAREGGDDLILEPFAYRGDLVLDPKTMPRVLKPRSTAPAAPGHERRENPRGQGIFFKVFRSAKPYVSGNVGADPHYSPLFRGSKCCIAVPLLKPQGDPLGVLLLESEREDAFALEHVTPLRELAEVARTYILKAQIFRDTATETHPVVLVGVDRKTMDTALMAARYDEPVLILGETGSGKELMARAIHRSGPRRQRPFEAINCSTLTGPLALSQLFGHVKGAFTDAKDSRPGVLEVADGGTLFLDEIEKMPLETQHLFLRVIETMEFSPVGAPNEKRKISVRFIAATNADLKKKMEEGAFLSDLYYRIGCLTITLPPLRDRKRFIPKLIERFLRRLAAKYSRPVPAVSARAVRMFREYEYPGNVRELQNLVTQAFTRDSDGEIDVEDLPDALLKSGRLTDTRYLPAVKPN